MRWRILALLFAARVGLGLQFQTMGAVGADLSGAFSLDNAQIWLMIGLFMVPGVFLAMPAGFSGRFASDRALAGAGLLALARRRRWRSGLMASGRAASSPGPGSCSPRSISPRWSPIGSKAAKSRRR